MTHPAKISRILTLFILGLYLFLTFVYAESTPPPPPPPCQIQSAGCYKTGDVKASFGELDSREFIYFLSENKCKKDGSCDCRGISENIPQEANPDDSSGACACIFGTDWNAKGRCCGDDQEDCGMTISGVLCNIDENLASSQWLYSSSNLGDIRYVGCTDAEFLSYGVDWLKCDGTFWRKTISNSEYMCIGRGRESIIECCGDGSCKSRVDGKRLSTGQSITPSDFISTEVPVSSTPIADSKTYYCRSDRKFVTDLDVPNSQINDKALIAKNKATCEKAGFIWTGTKCCSEADDPEEYYNDIDGESGCWNKEEVISIDFVEGTNDSVVNHNGQFYGCAVEESNFNKDNDKLLNIPDAHTLGPLI
ncbi:MAG: hypothetical protein AAB221_15905, partial [Bacteroidota bacterium]